MAASRIDPALAKAIEQSVAVDSQLKARVQQFVLVAVDRMERTIKTGAPAEVNQVLRSFVPVLVRALTQEHTDDKLEALKLEMQAMFSEMLEGYGAEEAQEQMEVEEDMPTRMEADRIA